MAKIRGCLNKKGQGIVEYALLLAFIVGIVMMLNGSNLGGAVEFVFNKVSGVLVGKTDWGHMDISEFNDSNSAERLSADQQALLNLANYFMGKTKGEIKDMLKNDPNHPEGYSADMAWGGNGEQVLLGWFSKDEENGGTYFVTSRAKGSGYEYGALNASEAQNIFSWMQGDDSSSYDATNKYLVSDYALSQGWTGEPGNNQGNGLKMRLEYDNNSVNVNKKVIGVKLAVDPMSQSAAMGSSGLEVQIHNGVTTFKDTGSKANSGMSNSF